MAKISATSAVQEIPDWQSFHQCLCLASKMSHKLVNLWPKLFSLSYLESTVVRGKSIKNLLQRAVHEFHTQSLETKYIMYVTSWPLTYQTACIVQNISHKSKAYITHYIEATIMYKTNAYIAYCIEFLCMTY